MKSKQPHVWVVETTYGDKWIPWCGGDTHKQEAQDTLSNFKRIWPNDKWRIAKYVRQP